MHLAPPLLARPDPTTGQARLVEVACWSHARRNIYEVHQETASPIAREALERIAALFVIEDGKPLWFINPDTLEKDRLLIS